MNERPALVYLGFGSNLGDRMQHLLMALEKLESKGVIEVVRMSAVIETVAVGLTDQPDFLNMAVEARAKLSPRELLKELLNVEEEMGRVRMEKWGPRIIDIDILYYGNSEIAEDGLVIPHPEIKNRRFVLENLSGIDVNLADPVNGIPITEYLRDCKDRSPVRPYHLQIV